VDLLQSIKMPLSAKEKSGKLKDQDKVRIKITKWKFQKRPY
jgi:hypothetical protein